MVSYLSPDTPRSYCRSSRDGRRNCIGRENRARAAMALTSIGYTPLTITTGVLHLPFELVLRYGFEMLSECFPG